MKNLINSVDLFSNELKNYIAYDKLALSSNALVVDSSKL